MAWQDATCWWKDFPRCFESLCSFDNLGGILLCIWREEKERGRSYILEATVWIKNNIDNSYPFWAFSGEKNNLCCHKGDLLWSFFKMANGKMQGTQTFWVCSHCSDPSIPALSSGYRYASSTSSATPRMSVSCNPLWIAWAFFTQARCPNMHILVLFAVLPV